MKSWLNRAVLSMFTFLMAQNVSAADVPKLGPSDLGNPDVALWSDYFVSLMPASAIEIIPRLLKAPWGSKFRPYDSVPAAFPEYGHISYQTGVNEYGFVGLGFSPKTKGLNSVTFYSKQPYCNTLRTSILAEMRGVEPMQNTAEAVVWTWSANNKKRQSLLAYIDVQQQACKVTFVYDLFLADMESSP